MGAIITIIYHLMSNIYNLMMIVYIGKNAVVSSRDILGVFDFETATIMKSTRNYLALADKKGETENVSSDIPSCFTVCIESSGKRKIYLSGKYKVYH